MPLPFWLPRAGGRCTRAARQCAAAARCARRWRGAAARWPQAAGGRWPRLRAAGRRWRAPLAAAAAAPMGLRRQRPGWWLWLSRRLPCPPQLGKQVAASSLHQHRRRQRPQQLMRRQARAPRRAAHRWWLSRHNGQQTALGVGATRLKTRSRPVLRALRALRALSSAWPRRQPVPGAAQPAAPFGGGCCGLPGCTAQPWRC